RSAMRPASMARRWPPRPGVAPVFLSHSAMLSATTAGRSADVAAYSMYTMPSCMRHDLDRPVSEPELARLRRTGADIVDATGRCRDNEQVSRVARTVDIDVEAAGCEYLTCAHQGIVAMPALIDPVRRSGVI